MNEKLKLNSKRGGAAFLVIVIVMLLLIVAVLGGIVTYLVKDNKLPTNGETNSNVDNSMVNTTPEAGDSSSENNIGSTYIVSKRNNFLQVIDRFVSTEMLVDLAGNAYIILPQNTVNTQVQNSFDKLKNNVKTYSPKGYVGYEGETSVNAIKLDIKNVVSVHCVTVGNGGLKYYVFIKEDGSLTTLNYTELLYEAKITLKNIPGVSNVITIMQNDYTNTPYAVDILGNEIDFMNGETNKITALPNTYRYNLSHRKSLQAISKGNVQFWVSADGNAYISLIGNVDNEKLKTLSSKFTNTNIKGYVGYEGETSINAYKLSLDSVLGAYMVNIGNGGFEYIIFLKENGQLAYLNYTQMINSGSIVINNVNNISNILSVVANDISPYAVDILGNEIYLHDYIK